MFYAFFQCIPPEKDRWRSPLPRVLVDHGPLLFAIAIYGLRKRCMLIGCINSRIKNLVGGVNPSAKICSSNWIISPRDRGEKRKYAKFHHLFGKSWSKNHHSFILFHPSAPDPSAPFMSSSIASAKARSVRTSNADVASSIKHTDLNRVGPGKKIYNPWKKNLRVSPPRTPGKKI